jgi:hypothetical protein
MIAPLRQTDPPPVGRRLREAHRFVAETLLASRRRKVPDAPSVPAWQAWLFAAWAIVATTVYFCAMLGCL